MTVAIQGCTGEDPVRVGTSSHASCPWIAGRWNVVGNCDATECIYYQDGCEVRFDCSSSDAFTFGNGTIDGNTFKYNGDYCSATITGRMMSGGCKVGATTCSYTATHR